MTDSISNPSSSTASEGSQTPSVNGTPKPPSKSGTVSKTSRLPPRQMPAFEQSPAPLSISPAAMELQRMRDELAVKDARIEELEQEVVDEKVKGAAAEGEAKSLRDQVAWLRSMLENKSQNHSGE